MEGRKSAYMDLVGKLKKINLLEDLHTGWRSSRNTVRERGLDLCGYE